MDHTYEVEEIRVIEWHMMDKRKYAPLTLLSGFTIRSALYPASLIKTRLQVQKNNLLYNGFFDAFRKIAKTEGFTGLYRGFWVTNLLIVPSLAYIFTYEQARHVLAMQTSVRDNKVRSFLSGGCASIISQTFLVPIDIVSQHLQLSGQKPTALVHHGHLDPLHVSEETFQSRTGKLKAIIHSVYKKDGLLGFYRGYTASLCFYVPNSALWWFFYDVFSTVLTELMSEEVPLRVVQVGAAAPLSAVLTSLIMTPMDAIRARIQVEGMKFTATTKLLWKEERWFIFTKGLSARLIQSVTFSVFIILGYESLKRWSLLEEYKTSVRR